MTRRRHFTSVGVSHQHVHDVYLDAVKLRLHLLRNPVLLGLHLFHLSSLLFNLLLRHEVLQRDPNANRRCAELLSLLACTSAHVAHAQRTLFR